MAVRQPRLWQSNEMPPAPGWRVAEFFAGMGLVRLGLERVGFHVVYANDIDPDKQRLYDDHFGDASDHFDLRDVWDVSGTEVPDVDLATASFPCTDLSLAGARAGLNHGEQSSAFWGFIEVLRTMGARRPRCVLLENVVGFLSSHGGRDFHAAMVALSELGYAVDPFIVDARWFVPQSRPRLFVVASQREAGNRCGGLEIDRLRPASVCEFIERHPDVAWHRERLPPIPEPTAHHLREILEDLPPESPEWWSQERTDYLYDQLSDRHRAIADGSVAARRWTYATAFRRVRQQADGTKRSMAELRTDGIAGCLRTPKGGSGRQILVKMGFGRFAVRLLTPRECARLMGAGEFVLSAPSNTLYFGFGDAVCADVIQWIGQHYLLPFLRSTVPPTLDCPVGVRG